MVPKCPDPHLEKGREGAEVPRPRAHVNLDLPGLPTQGKGTAPRSACAWSAAWLLALPRLTRGPACRGRAPRAHSRSPEQRSAEGVHLVALRRQHAPHLHSTSTARAGCAIRAPARALHSAARLCQSFERGAACGAASPHLLVPASRIRFVPPVAEHVPGAHSLTHLRAHTRARRPPAPLSHRRARCQTPLLSPRRLRAARPRAPVRPAHAHGGIPRLGLAGRARA